MQKPINKPNNPQFSSGPTTKNPDWSFDKLSNAVLGRSHRSAVGKARLKEAIDKARTLLSIPDNYRVGIVPASDTGAVEMAMWNLLGACGTDVFAWESFGKGWVTDAVKHLKLDDLRVFEAEYGELPDLSQAQPTRDIVFTWNGTTSGVKVPNADWISDERAGLTICDATSAAYAMELPWDKLDVTTWSWQKVMGSEAAHGMIVLSPRAVKRMQSYTPAWPLPKIFRLTKGNELIEGIFSGATINTPSMLCVEDVIQAHEWAESIGGLTQLIANSQANLSATETWVSQTEWVEFLVADKQLRSNTSLCLKITDDWFAAQSKEAQWATVKTLCKLLEEEEVAYDIAAYRDAPPGLRLWGGATVQTTDLEALFPWIEWAYATIKGEAAQAA